MSTPHQPGQTVNTFLNLARELSALVDVGDLKVAFDKDGNAYLEGRDFCEKLIADPMLHRLVRQEMLDIIAKYVPRIPLDKL